MANKSTVPFQGTKEQETALREVIEKRKSEQGALMAVLQQAQEIYGYVPTEVQTIISDEMDIPLHKIEEVVDFYPQFTLSPKGKYQVSICLGTACFVKGAGDVYNKLTEVLGIGGGECTADGKFSLDASRCIGACGMAPILMVNDDVYNHVKAEDVEEILAKYE